MIEARNSVIKYIQDVQFTIGFQVTRCIALLKTLDV